MNRDRRLSATTHPLLSAEKMDKAFGLTRSGESNPEPACRSVGGHSTDQRNGQILNVFGLDRPGVDDTIHNNIYIYCGDTSTPALSHLLPTQQSLGVEQNSMSISYGQGKDYELNL